LLSEHLLFLRQFRDRFHTTGAIAPSSRWLASALARQVRSRADRERPAEILEVGPGTGAITDTLVREIAPHDRLTLVELNDHFVEHLRGRFEREPHWRAVADRTRILHQPVEEFPHEVHFDHIVSGLPLNNFSVELVERILATFERLLAPGGTLSFFEDFAVRSLRCRVGPSDDRQRLSGVARAVDGWYERDGIGRDLVWLNLPPAWAVHIRKPPDGCSAGA